MTDITAPVATEALDTEAATSTANVTLGAVTWNPTTTPAAYATQYTATVIATAAANYAFADTVTATVNGQAATVTKNDGGTLTIAYTFEKTALTPVTITATDKKADWSADGIAIPVEGMFTITEGAGAATYTVTNGTGEGTYDAQTGKLTVTKCGTFTVKVSTAATDTYAAGAETTATLTVNKVDSTAATVTANTLIYTALVTVTGEATGGTMQYALGTKDAATEEYTTSIPAATNAGTYYVWYKVVGDENHTDTEAACIPVTVAKKAVTVTAADQTVKLNESIDTTVSKAILTGAVEGTVLTAVTLTAGSTQAVTTQGTITASAATIKTADGEEDVTANYEITYQTGKLTVEKVPVTITTQPVAGNRSYDGTTQSLLSSAGVADGGTIVYALGDNAQTAPAEGYSTTIPTAVNPGTYYVWCDVAEDGNHEAIEPFCITVEVAVSGIMGDVNGDGIVDIADALMISRYDVELVTLNKNQLALGDITGDGSVDIADALYISRLDAGLLEE